MKKKIYFINNEKYTLSNLTNPTILDVCNLLEYNIPRFCYHPKLSVAGNCRMCLVDVEGSLKPVASCSMPLLNSMRIYTNTARIKRAREGVLEFLLANHPLDCPICDQGGECDLQDQAMIFGGDKGRFYEEKRAVEDKNCGPLIKTLMTRCIHCTRCIRFYTEIAGASDFGTIGRGLNMEVGTYVSKILTSELSGNIIDLCPVGALTSKPYAFRARSWELSSIESIDILDAICSKIRIDIKDNTIMRILPAITNTIIDSWISDKARFSYDGLQQQRLQSPMIFKKTLFITVTWLEIFIYITFILKKSIKFLVKKPAKINFNMYTGDFVDIESLILLKDMFNKCGYKKRQINNLNSDIRFDYLFNISEKQFNKIDLIFLLGAIPRFEAPLINIKIRKLYLKKKIYIFYLGPFVNLTYNIQHLGNSIKILKNIIKGIHWVNQFLVKSTYPLIIKGSSYIEATKKNNFIDYLLKFLPDLSYTQLNTLQTNVTSLNNLDLNLDIINKENFNLDKNLIKFNINYLLNYFPKKNLRWNLKSFIIYQGHHGDKSILTADVLLPSTTYMEKKVSYTTLYGTIENTSCVIYPTIFIRNDWKIVKVLTDFFNLNLNISSEIDYKKRFLENSPHYNKNLIKKIYKNQQFLFFDKVKKSTLLKKNIFYIQNNILLPFINNFYQNDIISKSSSVMSLCVQQFSKRNQNFSNIF